MVSLLFIERQREHFCFILLNDTHIFSFDHRYSIMNHSMTNETDNHAFLAVIYHFEIIIFPILILMGSLCNILTFIVMRRRRMRISSTCFYMAALAVTDTLVLWTGCLNQWFYLIHLPTLVVTSNLTCKLLPFLFVFFADARYERKPL
jgi:hypothetical protein